MYDTYKMQDHICKELEKKAQAGIKSTSDLDTVWKLIDAYKNLLKIDMLQEASEYSEGGYSQTGYSERRRRDSMGRYSSTGGNSYNDESSYRGRNSYRGGMSYDNGYSEAKGDLMEARQSYRASRSPESKRGVMDAAKRMKETFEDELKELIAGADSREERDVYTAMLHGLEISHN